MIGPFIETGFVSGVCVSTEADPALSRAGPRGIRKAVQDAGFPVLRRFEADSRVAQQVS